MCRRHHPPLAVLGIAGQKSLHDPSYTNDFLNLRTTHPTRFNPSFANKVFTEYPLPISSPLPWPNGPPGAIDLSLPRFAWLFQTATSGQTFISITPDEDTSTLDLMALISKIDDASYLATCFLQGERDSLVRVEFANRAHEVLKAKGVVSELVVAEGKDHTFEEVVRPGDEGYAEFERAFGFLRRMVEE